MSWVNSSLSSFIYTTSRSSVTQPVTRKEYGMHEGK